MSQKYKPLLTSDEIAFCSTVGAGAGTLVEKIAKLFEELRDPLLAVNEVKELLGGTEEEEEHRTALETLVRDGILECSTNTQRPLDKEESTKLFRRKLSSVGRLKIVAVESTLSNDERRYQFTCDGRIIRSLAKVDRLDAISGTGQQRDEIRKHVEKIAAGIEGGNQVPNAILLTLNKTNCLVDPAEDETPPDSFIVIRGISEQVEVANPYNPAHPVQMIRSVEIDFPFRPVAFDDEKAALLVDGQQRTAALSMVDIEKMPAVALSVIAVIADADEAKKVFQIANSTQKITVEFSRALLAAMDDAPGYLRAEQDKARACRILAIEDANSPFKGIVRYPGTTPTRSQIVAYNSLFQVVTTFADSALPIEQDAKLLSATVTRSFKIVSEVWPEAWNKKPTESKLMHGAGLRAMAALCADIIVSGYRQHQSLEATEIWTQLRESLKRLRTVVLWESSALSGNKSQAKNYRDHISDKQNTSQDILDLTKFLQKESLAVDKQASRKPQTA